MDEKMEAARDELMAYSDEHFAIEIVKAKPDDWNYVSVKFTTNGHQWSTLSFYTKKQFVAFKKAIREFKD